MKMNAKDVVKRVYDAVHFPAFLVVLTLFSQYLSIFPQNWRNGITSLAIPPFEKNILGFLSRYILTNHVYNFLMMGIIFLVFCIISLDRKKFITLSLVLYFFIYFFEFFFIVRLETGLITTLGSDLWVSILLTAVMFIVFLIVPTVIQDKIAGIRRKNKLSRKSSPLVLHECKNCGQKYQSNPLYCAKCMAKLA
jgi:hypothetical protein